MKLFPHEVLEAVNKAEAAFEKGVRTVGPEEIRKAWADAFTVSYDDRKAYFQDVRRLLTSGIVYDFGRLTPDDAHVEFAALLFEHSDYTEYPTTVIVQDTSDKSVRVLSVVESSGKRGLTFHQFTIDTLGQFIPIGTLLDARLASYSKEKMGPKGRPHDGKPVEDGTAVVDVGSVARMSTRNYFDVEDRVFATKLSYQFGQCMGLLAMLGCKEVERVTVPAPAKLNKRRLTNHKPAIQERTEVKINITSKALQVDYLTDDTPNGMYGRGTKKRPHWRRPHPHRLPKSGIVKLYPPAWVNWDEDSGLPRPPIKDYKIR